MVTKALVYSVLKGIRREGFNHKAVAIVGGALLPLHANFAPDRDLFIKDHAS